MAQMVQCRASLPDVTNVTYSAPIGPLGTRQSEPSKCEKPAKNMLVQRAWTVTRVTFSRDPSHSPLASDALGIGGGEVDARRWAAGTRPPATRTRGSAICCLNQFRKETVNISETEPADPGNQEA